MNDWQRTIHLAATNPTFRQALQTDPEAAIVSHGLSLSEEEWAALIDVWDLLIHQPATGLDDRGADAPNPPWWFGGLPVTQATLTGQ